jgi:hypothetical protein
MAAKAKKATKARATPAKVAPARKSSKVSAGRRKTARSR